ncbi:MAG: relaxase/mobilization nuclease domain-containing protein [Trueperaceae bacterium]
MNQASGAYLGNYRSSGSDKVRGTRSVVKATAASAKTAKGTFRGKLRYAATRENSRGEKQDREIFSKDKDQHDLKEATTKLKSLSSDESYHLAYRFVLSPDTGAETSPEAMRDWTREMMTKVERNHQLEWFAVAHAGDNAHTNHAHVHVVAVIDRRINKDELAALRQYGDVHWQDSVTRQTMLERDDRVTVRDIQQRLQTQQRQAQSDAENHTIQTEKSASKSNEKTQTPYYGPEH